MQCLYLHQNTWTYLSIIKLLQRYFLYQSIKTYSADAVTAAAAIAGGYCSCRCDVASWWLLLLSPQDLLLQRSAMGEALDTYN